MDVRLVLLILAFIGPIISQKLFFKSLREELQKNDEIKSIKDEAVPCPGGKSACPDGNTCCMLLNRAFGCCALQNATCCLDGKHCCPRGLKCDLGRKACISEDEVIPWTDNQSTQEVDTVVDAVQCDDYHECPTGNTCCKLPTGQWGCCPKPNAVCCDDHIHCCPQGSTCDTKSGQCHKDDLKIDWLTKKPASKTYKADRVPAIEIDWVNSKEPNVDLEGSSLADEVGAVRCDAEHECENEQTCCKLASGEWGCCPIPNAVCCSDHVHCCPDGTTCDVSSGKCNQGDLQIDWFMKKTAVSVRNVKCDDKYECKTGETCCKLSSGGWGCCPIPNAVCCSDHVHCCPDGTTCDVSSGKCNQGDLQIDWFTKKTAVSVRNVKCDDKYECKTGETCCKLSSGGWGCCPIPNAVCCSDHVHCCPEGTTCDVSSGKCNQGDLQIDWFMKKTAVSVRNVKCDDKYECKTGETCCKLSSGGWGCCPIPNAFCCSDHVHCCPDGTTCDVSSGKCNQGDLQIDWFMKKTAVSVRNVKCDDKYECKTGETCCKLSSGGWGCCPIPNAVCCSDHVHCCPDGTTCDVSSGKCNQGDLQIDWFTKKTAVSVRNVKCDDKYECKTGETCCKLSSGGWGCCPIPNAVCCSDHVHCCPDGTTCDVSSGKCNQGDLQIDWFTKKTAVSVRNVKCDDHKECHDGQTCCKLADGQWGCCPIPNAVCCSDDVHCCPSGTTCDVKEGKCNRGNIQIDWFTKAESQTVSTSDSSVIDWYEKEPALKLGNVMCDKTHACPDGQTCCKLASGQWGCCPLPNAVCCSDHVHCCPSGDTCDVASGKCNWQTSNRGPIDSAVCCSDHVHCCPEGDTCDVASGKCNSHTSNRGPIDWVQKVPAQQLKTVQCDDTHFCADGQTCCVLASGQWGCCPIPNAACCSDHVHCCPSGYTCDVSTGSCLKQSILSQIKMVEKEPALQLGVVQCDSTHYCQSGQTCCKLASGQWGCCPIPKAVCCSDHVHCCPSGDTCDVSSGKCTPHTSNRGPIDWVQKVPAQQLNMVKCDSTHFCPDGKTCCVLASGQWGCCPISNAVCCTDHVHCCPSGYTCDVSSGTCNKGREQLDWFLKEKAGVMSSHVKSVESVRSDIDKVGQDGVKCDATQECPAEHTCCKLSSGDWGCCPLPKAVCCSDGIHCCPEDTTCNVAAGTCTRGNIEMEWFVKQPAISTSSKVQAVICPDGSECQNEQTCCPMYTYEGSYGCCPMPNAVCCSDGQHCCPHGYKCDVGHGTCVLGKLMMPWSKTMSNRRPALQGDGIIDNPVNNGHDANVYVSSNGQGIVIHEDGVAQGSDAHINEGIYGEVNVDKYQNGGISVPCEGTSEGCPDMYTCCPGNDEDYKCCPYHQAVCCPDHEHCCPTNYICDEEPGICRIPETKPGARLLNKLYAKKGVPLR